MKNAESVTDTGRTKSEPTITRNTCMQCREEFETEDWKEGYCSQRCVNHATVRYTSFGAYCKRWKEECGFCGRMFIATKMFGEHACPLCKGASHNHKRRWNRMLARSVLIKDEGKVATFIGTLDENEKTLAQIGAAFKGGIFGRECEECGALFRPKRSDSKYCSAKCRQKAYRSRQLDKSKRKVLSSRR